MIQTHQEIKQVFIDEAKKAGFSNKKIQKLMPVFDEIAWYLLGMQTAYFAIYPKPA